MSTTRSPFHANFLDRWSLLLAIASLVTLMTAFAGISISVICVFMALVGGIFFTVLMAWHSHRRQADWVTYFRLGLTVLFLVRGALGPMTWADPIFASFILSLDGLDGHLARRQGPTRAGAVFDMEADAFFVLALSLLSIGLAKLPLWLLILPAWRYLYVLMVRVMRQFHPTALHIGKSWRGTIVCVITLLALILNLIPTFPFAMKLFISGTTVLLLSASFLADLWNQAPRQRLA